MRIRGLLVLALAVFVIILGINIGLWRCNIPSSLLSEFGQSFGLASAVFSGLAFVGVAFAIIFQWQQLRNQRQETQETLRLMNRTAEAQERTLVFSTLEAFWREHESLAPHIQIIHSHLISKAEQARQLAEYESVISTFVDVVNTPEEGAGFSEDGWERHPVSFSYNKMVSFWDRLGRAFVAGGRLISPEELRCQFVTVTFLPHLVSAWRGTQTRTNPQLRMIMRPGLWAICRHWLREDCERKLKGFADPRAFTERLERECLSGELEK